jgi:hypothetical protein
MGRKFESLSEREFGSRNGKSKITFEMGANIQIPKSLTMFETGPV